MTEHPDIELCPACAGTCPSYAAEGRLWATYEATRKRAKDAWSAVCDINKQIEIWGYEATWARREVAAARAKLAVAEAELATLHTKLAAASRRDERRQTEEREATRAWSAVSDRFHKEALERYSSQTRK